MKVNTYADRIGASTSDPNASGPEEWQGVVHQLVSTLRFGVVQITVHESHVVQVERTEKVRFAQPAALKPNR